MPRQKITRPAKPGKERGKRKHVERRNLTAVMDRPMTVRYRAMPHMSVPRQMKVQVREMQAQTAGEKNHHTQKEPDDKTHQVEISQSHRRPPRLPLVAFGFSASSNRSANPGVSRIAPINRKALRVSFSRAALIRISLNSRSPAKRSEPWSNHTSSLPSTVRKSEVSSV